MLRLRCSRNAATSSSRRMLRRVGWARRWLSSVKAISELGSFEELLLSHDRTTQVLKVELNREHRLNALSEKMGREILSLCEALKNAGPDSGIRCLVITGAGRSFSTGRDLKDSINHTPEDAKRYLELCFDSANALASVPVPTVAAINGPCFGWGLEAALGCDVRLTTDSAKLCFPETRIGIFPGAGGVARLCKLVPLAHAKQMVFSARVMDGKEAAASGLVNESFSSPERLEQEAMELARDIAANAPLAVQSAKALFDSIEHKPLADALQLSRPPRMALTSTSDFAEGLQAFKEKRKPIFRGK